MGGAYATESWGNTCIPETVSRPSGRADAASATNASIKAERCFISANILIYSNGRKSQSLN